MDIATGEKLWDFATGDKITSSPTVADGTVYIGSHDGKLYAIK
ncbi:MAG: PQQ-binding-like beta-propeller repeat protein [Dehalococcoidales bacterium]|nr:PQQ-binding-like beta-propeller repeat protein [Dehalococcoidales bacterium]